MPFPISVNGTFATTYPKIVEPILQVDIEASRWADAHPDETVAIFVKETGNSEAAVRSTYSDGKFHLDPAITPQAVEALKGEEKFMADAALLKGKVDYDTWVDRSFYDAALAQVAASN